MTFPPLYFWSSVLCPEDFFLIQDSVLVAAKIENSDSSSKGMNNDSENPYIVEDDDLYESDDLLLKRLTLFFQKTFMKWVNNPPCQICGSTETQFQGTRGCSTPEEFYGDASRVESKCDYSK